MIVSYKYYIYNEQDLTQLNTLTTTAGKIYNHCIALHKRYYKLFNKHFNKFQLQKHLTKLKKLDKYSYWKKLGSQAIQELTERIEEGYQKFFKWATKKTQIKAGTPTFKKSKEYPSFKMKGEVGYKLIDNKVVINKKLYRFKKHREFEGNIKTCTIKRAKLKLAKAHKKLSNQREDWQWKIAYNLVKEYDIIKVEDLNISGMKKLFGRKVSDLAYSNFLEKVEYLSNKYGKIDRFYPSSQLCHNCGTLNPQMKKLKIRILDCSGCNNKYDRDLNAAINIKRWDKNVSLSNCKTSSTEANYATS